jgi:hypothetical protein
MAAAKLKITDLIDGLPKQKVPLRYAVLVTGLSVCTFTACLAEFLDIDRPQKGAAIKASELSTSGIRNCSPNQFALIHKQMKTLTSAKEQMNLLPANWYIESTDLAILFTRYIDMTVGRKNATVEKLELNWNPPIAGYDSLIKSSFSSLANTNLKSKQEIRREKTARTHQAWFKEYKSYIAKKPSANTSEAARAVGKKFSVRAETVRRVITKLKNS